MSCISDAARTTVGLALFAYERRLKEEALRSPEYSDEYRCRANMAADLALRLHDAGCVQILKDRPGTAADELQHVARPKTLTCRVNPCYYVINYFNDQGHFVGGAEYAVGTHTEVAAHAVERVRYRGWAYYLIHTVNDDDLIDALEANGSFIKLYCPPAD